MVMIGATKFRSPAQMMPKAMAALNSTASRGSVELPSRFMNQSGMTLVARDRLQRARRGHDAAQRRRQRGRPDAKEDQDGHQRDLAHDEGVVDQLVDGGVRGQPDHGRHVNDGRNCDRSHGAQGNAATRLLQVARHARAHGNARHPPERRRQRPARN